MSKTIFLATNNIKNIKVLQQMLGSHWRVLDTSAMTEKPQWDETGSSFEENAKIKVDALTPFCDGLILGDDSGLEVDALDGAPGVYSSRYAGEDGNDAANNSKLIAALRDVPKEKRSARFRCCLCLRDTDGTIHYFNGTCEGLIGFEQSGTGGFGYDPLFFPAGSDRTLAEHSAEEKNRISHRAKALQEFLKFMS